MIEKKLSKSKEVKVQKKRGRPRKVKPEEQSSKQQRQKLSLAEKQEIKLKKQQERQELKAKSGTTQNVARFYCTNKELMAEMLKWRDSNPDPEKRVMSERFGQMLISIADKILNHSNFRHYSKELKEDMKSFFFYKAIHGLKNYNFAFNNPFAFFSTAAFNAYITIIGRHYKHINIKKDLMQKMLVEIQTCPGLQPNSSLAKNIQQYLEYSSANLDSEGQAD